MTRSVCLVVWRAPSPKACTPGSTLGKRFASRAPLKTGHRAAHVTSAARLTAKMSPQTEKHCQRETHDNKQRLSEFDIMKCGHFGYSRTCRNYSEVLSALGSRAVLISLPTKGWLGRPLQQLFLRKCAKHDNKMCLTSKMASLRQSSWPWSERFDIFGKRTVKKSDPLVNFT